METETSTTYTRTDDGRYVATVGDATITIRPPYRGAGWGFTIHRGGQVATMGEGHTLRQAKAEAQAALEHLA